MILSSLNRSMIRLLPAARTHGFRLSVRDGVVLVLGTSATGWLWSAGHPLWWIVAMALGHFFLFCNVFLVWRRWELLWAATFVANVAAHVSMGSISGLSVLLWQLPVTCYVIVRQIRSPWYHGIAAGRLNPQLNEYLNGTL